MRSEVFLPRLQLLTMTEKERKKKERKKERKKDGKKERRNKKERKKEEGRKETEKSRKYLTRFFVLIIHCFAYASSRLANAKCFRKFRGSKTTSTVLRPLLHGLCGLN